MLIVTTRFSKKKAVLTVIAVGAIMALLVILASVFPGPDGDRPRLSDNTQRVSYLQSLGWEVEPDPLETLQFLLPETLAEPYLTYNRLQKEQGFDLTDSCGKQVTRYTYAVTNYPDRPQGVDLTDSCGKQVTRYTYAVTNYPDRPQGVQLNLYVCEEQPVAGDVCCPGADGFQQALLDGPGSPD